MKENYSESKFEYHNPIEILSSIQISKKLDKALALQLKKVISTIMKNIYAYKYEPMGELTEEKEEQEFFEHIVNVPFSLAFLLKTILESENVNNDVGLLCRTLCLMINKLEMHTAHLERSSK